MEPSHYVRGVGFTRRLLIYPDRIEAQIRHPLYYSWETVRRFATTELFHATKYVESAETWPAIPKTSEAQRPGQPM